MRVFRVALQLLITSMLVSGAFAGCGGGGPSETSTPDEVSPDTPEQEQPSGEVEAAGSTMEVSGLLGTIPEHKVQQVFERKMDALGECYGLAIEVLEEIEGRLEVDLVVGGDGSVTEAYLRDGTLGSLEAEECIVGKVQRFRFPAPEGGGRAEVSYSLVLDAPYDPPEPQNWSGPRLNEVVAEHTPDMERCLAGQTGVQLTLYIGPGGQVVSAGATASSAELYEAALCLARAAAAWVFPDPGDKPAKASAAF
jgi:hypothetical protein